MRRTSPVALALALHLLVSATTSPARAGEGGNDIVEARADYDAAAAAYDRNDYATAAVRFARADERVPNPRALRLAMASALLVSDAALGMNLVERSEQRARSGAVDPVVTGLARKLRARFQGAAARLRASCTQPSGSCTASVDGEPMGASRTRWVAPGRHVVAITEGAGAPAATEHVVTVRAGEMIDVPRAGAEEAATTGGATAAPPATSSAPAAGARPAEGAEGAEGAAANAGGERAAGLSPLFFWSGVAATGIAAGAATALTVVVAGKHDEFVDRPSAETARDGDAAQTRARAVWVVAGAFAITTVVLGVFTDFGGHTRSTRTATLARPAPAPSWNVGVGAGGVSVAGSFW